jgi:uncharacterized membrane protein YhaH (DUF805 family)
MFEKAFDPRQSRFALSPFGRVGPLLSARGVSLYRDNGDRLLHLILFVGILFPVAALVLYHEVYPPWEGVAARFCEVMIPGSFVAYAYSVVCWNIRRLHDLGKTGLHVLVSLLFVAGVVIVPAMSFVLVGAISVMAGFANPFLWSALGVIVGAIGYVAVVFYPHARRWREAVVTAPGESAPNRFGPTVK